MNFWEKGTTPELGAIWLAPSAEKDVVVLGIDCEIFFLKKNMVVMVAQWYDTHQVVVKLGHYVTRYDRAIYKKETS